MTSTVSSSSTTTPNNTSQTASASAGDTGVASSIAKGKPVPQGPAIASSTPLTAVPGQAQHVKASLASPMNGKPNSGGNSSSNSNTNLPKSPAVPAPGTGGPAIVSSGSITNGASSTTPVGDHHSRKPSSVTISAMSNGGATTGQAGRPNISFGSMNAGGSPAIANSVPHMPPNSNANLNTPMGNPGPARSPSPIPHPAVSGGRPPSGPQGQGSQLNFGSLPGAESGDQSLRSGQAVPPTGPQHLRQGSNQSAHSDMSAGINRNFVPNNGRGRGYNPSYPPSNLAHSPNVFRPGLAMQPRNPSNVPPFQAQASIRPNPNSPYQANRSPAMAAAAMQHPQQQQQAQQPQQQQAQQPHLANGPPMPHPYGGYPQHLNPQTNAGMYGMPHQQFDPYYYAQPFVPQAMPTMQFPGAPPSPRPYNAPHGPQQPYMPAQYQAPAPGMSRNASSQGGPERPSSTLGQSPTPNLSQPSHPHTPVPSSSSPGPTASSFTRPERGKSKAIVIKTQSGDIVDLKNISAAASSSSSSPAPPQNRPPAVVSSGGGVPSTSTPPPAQQQQQQKPQPAPPSRSAVSSPPHARSDSQHAKSAEETKREFNEQFKRQLEAEKAEERRKKEEENDKDKEEVAVKTTQIQPEPKKDAEPKVEPPPKATEDVKATIPAPATATTTAAEVPAATTAPAEDSGETEEEKAERIRKEEEERWIAEMEELERLEEEREREYQEKKKRDAQNKAQKEAEAASKLDEELKRAEREAEELEEAKLKGKTDDDESPEAKAERDKLFASLKRPTLGPGANTIATAGTTTTTTLTVPPVASPPSGASTPGSESMPPPSSAGAATARPSSTLGKPKPAALKLETTKAVEPAQPTAGMQSLRSARFLQLQQESVSYPDGIRSPNPALNQGSKSRGRQYDKSFLLQFQEVFREKPSIDWDKILKETVGESGDSSARPQSARTPSMSGRQGSRTGPAANAINPMGMFGASQGRTLPPGTTSEARFAASSQVGGRPPMNNPFGSFASRPGVPFPMSGPPVMTRQGSSQSVNQQGNANSPRNTSSRGRGSRRGGPGATAAQEAQLAKTMPLTAGQDLRPLEVSKAGWKPTSIIGGGSQPLPGGHMPPDMVQRKVKSALNKMTPEKFEKISMDILAIAAQSKDESDGRTLRQVIQLTFEKACDEAHWASMYAKFCKRMLETMSPDIKDENVRDKNDKPVVGGALFRKYLLNRCQEEFERGWEVNIPPKPEGHTEEAAMLSDEYYTAAAAKRRGLGLVQFIGELYKLGMLTVRIMHECVHKLLNFEGLPDESAIESLVKLLRTVGATMDANPTGHNMIIAYFDRIETIMSMDTLPSRMYYMLLDTVDLRRKGWKSRDDEKGPKTISEIHQETLRQQQAAELERQKANVRGGRPPMGRGDARSFSSSGPGGLGMPPPDYTRNQVQMDDLKKLTRGARQTNQASSSTGSLGPTSMLGSRSNSGRKGLGPLSRGADDSGASSRTGTPPVKEKESTAHVNAYSALAGLDASGEGADEVASPPSTASSPPLTKSVPAVSKPVDAVEGSKAA